MHRFILLCVLLLFSSLVFADVVVVKDDITGDVVWTSNNEYHLDGLIFVDTLSTLTIEPGTVIKGLLQSNITTGDGASALLVRRGAKIFANGSPQAPIIFTSELDDVNDPEDFGYDDRGLWGGVVLLGRATTNQPTQQNQIEGVPVQYNARYGGTDDNDNSGVLRYVSIRHAGFSISGIEGDELNGLTMGAVGSGTTIEFIEVFANFDDGYEWFGGTVNTKYLVSAFCGDDAYDYDQGFRGKHQFWFAVQATDEAGRGGEHDGGDDDKTAMPYSKPLITNVTYIGAGSTTQGVAGDGNDRALYFRDNAGGKYWSSIFTEFVGRAITVEDLPSGEDSRSRLENGDLLLSNNYWWNFGAGATLDLFVPQEFVRTHLLANNNHVADPMLRGISREANKGLDPRPKTNSPAASGAIQPDDDFYTKVSYHGAFDPNGALWTDGWTAIYSMGFTGYIQDETPGVVVVKDDITGDVVWTSNNEYHLDGLIFVDTLSTLTIEPGTVIKGLLQSNITTGDGASALLVRRGAKIFANGSPQAPIIFTSELDDVNDPEDFGYDDRGLWGGVVLLGRATTNQPTQQNQIEGVPVQYNARYGGTDDNDNSGVLRYVSIRHAGFSISGIEGDELNGLTMGAVGSGTTIEFIEVFANFDDGYEWFGGTVNTKYLVSAFCGDDAYDYDQGFRGKHQFWFAVQATDEAGRGGEHDGGDDDKTAMPYSKPLITNVTYIGAGSTTQGVAGDGNDRALYFRDNAGGKYWSSIFTEFVGRAITVEDLPSGEDSRSRLENGDLLLSNNYWWNFGAGATLDLFVPQEFVRTHLLANNNHVADPMLRGISREANKGLDPRPKTNSPAASGAIQPDDDFYTKVSYHGAFDPNGALWTDGWTAIYSMGFTGDVTSIATEKKDGLIPSGYALSQNYPNPFNPVTMINFDLPEANDINLSVYNLLGQKIVTLAEGRYQAGRYQVTWNAENLASGRYIYRLKAGNQVISKSMLLIK